MNSDTFTILILINIVLSVLIIPIFIGAKRNIGYGYSALACIFLSPIIGIIITLLSKKNEKTLKSEIENSLGKVNEINAKELKTNLNSSINILTDLRDKGILTDEEYYQKAAKIKAEEAKQDIQNSFEYKQLQSLRDSKVLTSEEFEIKIKLLENIPPPDESFVINDSSFIGDYIVSEDTFSYFANNTLVMTSKSGNVYNGTWYLIGKNSLKIKLGTIDTIFRNIKFDRYGFTYTNHSTQFYAKRVK